MNDGNRASIACKDSIWRTDLIELCKQVLLELQILDGGFNHEITISEVFQSGCTPQSTMYTIQICRCQLATLYSRLQGLFDTFKSLCQILIAHFTYERIVSGTGTNLGDTGAHQPSSYNTDS